uniref:Uncharacterized protein n=2 Tax=Rhizophora mucronata TaxID=61149 RepID=A0A2P2LX00_RHIMU
MFKAFVQRESALQNKHDEFPNSVLESPEHNITTSSNVASPSKPSSEASAQADIASMSHLTLTNKGKVGPEDVERSCSDQMQNNRDRPGDAEALSQNSNFLSKEVSPSCAVEKNETVGSLPPLCSRIIGSVDSPKSEVPEKPNGDRANNPNKQNSQNKTPTNVRKMITAFESSLNQDMKPQTRPSSIRSQSRKTWVEADQNSSQLNEERTKKNIPVRSLSGNFRSLLHTDDDVLSSTSSQYTKKSESRAEHLLTKEKYVYFKNNYTTMDHEVDIEKEKMSSEKLTRASTSERASARGRTLHEHVSVSGNLYYMRGQGSNLLLKENAKETHIKGSPGYLDIRGASGDSNYLLESSGGWTFPDGGGKRPCLTAGGKRMTNLMGDLSTDNKSPTGKTNFSEAENMKKCNVPGTTRLEPKGREETSQRPQKTKSGDSTDSETSTGPLGQVAPFSLLNIRLSSVDNL